MPQNGKNDYTVLRMVFSLLTWGSLVFVAIIPRGETSEVIPILLFMGIFLVVINGFIWNWGNAFQQNDQASSDSIAEEEKRKRDMLDSVLRNMSNEQLRALRTRLEDPDFEDELQVMLGDDGELITRER